MLDTYRNVLRAILFSLMCNHVNRLLNIIFLTLLYYEFFNYVILFVNRGKKNFLLSLVSFSEISTSAVKNHCKVK